MKFRNPWETTATKGRYYQAHETARADEVNGLRLAGFGQRAMGFGIDFLLVSLLRQPVEYLWVNYMPHGWERHTRIDLLHVRSLIVLVLYFALALFFGRGRTIGKWIVGTRVVSLTHERLSMWQAIERALGYGASFLEVGFGFLQFFINRNRQCVHDRIAETIVADVRKSATRLADGVQAT